MNLLEWLFTRCKKPSSNSRGVKIPRPQVTETSRLEPEEELPNGKHVTTLMDVREWRNDMDQPLVTLTFEVAIGHFCGRRLERTFPLRTREQVESLHRVLSVFGLAAITIDEAIQHLRKAVGCRVWVTKGVKYGRPVILVSWVPGEAREKFFPRIGL